MKFRKQLKKEAVPEWADLHINYKHLKRLIRKGSDEAEFTEATLQELSRVSSFFLWKMESANKQLSNLQHQVCSHLPIYPQPILTQG